MTTILNRSPIFGFYPMVDMERLTMHDADFEALGFKCGLEIHQQLLTERKLFCRCPPIYRNDPAHYEIIRHMRPTLSEMGTYDGTALMEFKTKKNITYQFFRDTTCSYEIDETPPFELDPKALEISMVIASAMNCALVDEVHVSRKQYLDGSIPTGFQRTAIISLGGHVPWVGQDREIEIRQISLEEDACREISDKGHEVVFRTDRLSIPLVEVVTEPNAKTPQEAGVMAEILGWVMRSTGLVRRGSGATRQDVNVSVEGGRRVEIKGVPKIDLIPPITAGEAVRQYNLLKINEELNNRSVDPGKMDAEEFTTMVHEDVTDIFQGREVDLFDPWFEGEVAIRDDLDIRAVLIPGFKGLFSHPTHGDQTFADEVGGRLRVIACLDRMPNLMPSDDEPFSGVTEQDIEKVKERLGALEDDSIVLVWGPKRDTITGVQEIYIRSREAFDGVPLETRQLITPDMTTFERILPGPDRMYPDTDRPPIVVTEEILDNVNAQTPCPWWETEKEMVEAGVPTNVAHRSIVSKYFSLYNKAVKAGAPPRFTAIFIMEKMKAMERAGLAVRDIDDTSIVNILSAVGNGQITTRAASNILKASISDGAEVQGLLKDRAYLTISAEEARKKVKKVLDSSSDLAEMFRNGRENPLMGKLMADLGQIFPGSSVRLLAFDLLS